MSGVPECTRQIFSYLDQLYSLNEEQERLQHRISDLRSLQRDILDLGFPDHPYLSTLREEEYWAGASLSANALETSYVQDNLRANGMCLP